MHSTMKTFLSGAILLGIGSTAFADAVTYAVPDETAAFKPGPNVWSAPIEWSRANLSAELALAPRLAWPVKPARMAQPAIARPAVPAGGSPATSADVRCCNDDASFR